MSGLTFNKDTNEYNVSPISYTNKDFRAIYEELLDIIGDLTERWDPKSTNESDPGLILVKLKAFLADKLNYNIDKNTLENFPSQVTQRGNAQKLYDILGYGMKYYQSATTKITLRYNKGNNAGIYNKSYTIPAFTSLTDDSNTINFVTTHPVEIPTIANNKTNTECEIMEGIANDFTINSKTLITVDNLDADYRLYFMETMIAQNGIFISNANTNIINDSNQDDSYYWKQVTNLEATELGKKVFKFGVMPNTNTCYIEFPQDAANLFGSGIYIKYLITKGIEGNIGAHVLTSIANELIDDNIKEQQQDDNGSKIQSSTSANLKNYTLIIQPEGATNGENPESLKQAYKNCKKNINTFNTLVTVQDYQNAIYNLFPRIVSNCVVSDRTNDINYSYKVVNKTSDGDRIIPLNTGTYNKDTKIFTPDMNAFQIGIYALNDIDNVNNEKAYDRSFQTNSTAIENAQKAVEEYKSIQHDFIDTVPHDSVKNFIFKNIASLEGKVLTYRKVSKLEAEEIQLNIKNYLYKQYQAKNVDFGQELNYNDLINTIKESDPRIREVILEYPEYQLCVMRSDNSKENVGLQLDLNGDISYNYYETDYYAIFTKDEGAGTLSLQVKYNFYKNHLNESPDEINDYIENLNNDNFKKLFVDNTINKSNIKGYSFNNFETFNTEISETNYNDLYNAITNEEDKKLGVVRNGNSTIKKSIFIDKSIEIPDLTQLQAEIIAKSILSGATPYFIFDNNWVLNYSMGPAKKYDTTNYDQEDGLIKISDPNGNNLSAEESKIGNSLTGKDGVAAITTSVEIDLDSDNTYTLKDNENIFCVGPSYVSKAQLSTCLYYAFLSNNSSSIPANSYYTLSSNEYLIAAEGLDSNNCLDLSKNIKKCWIYGPGNIIYPTMDIPSKSWGNAEPVLGLNYDKIKVTAAENLGTSNTIEILGENKVQINKDNKLISAVWNIDNLDNKLFDIEEDLYYIDSDGNHEKYNNNVDKTKIKKFYLKKLLQNNDFFIYTDENKEDLVLLGSGTEIIAEYNVEDLSNKSPYSLTNQFKNSRGICWAMDPIDISSISTNGLNNSIDWNEIPLNIHILTAEKQIISLGKDIIIKYNKDLIIGNNPKLLNGSFQYKQSSEDAFTSLPSIISENNNKWSVFSRLSLITSPMQGQLLKENQAVNLYTAEMLPNGTIQYNLKATLGPQQYITSNYIMSLSGGYQQNTAVLEGDGTFKRTLEIYVSGKTSDSETNQSVIENAIKSARITNYSVAEYPKYIEATLEDLQANKKYILTLNLSPQFNNTLIPILFASSNNSILKIEGAKCINDDNNGIQGAQNKYLRYFKIEPINNNEVNLTLEIETGEEDNKFIKLTIFNPLKILKNNPLIEAKIKSLNNTTVIDEFNNLNMQWGSSNVGLFDYSYQINEEDQISNPLDPESFFLPNHPFNRWVIPQLNTGEDGTNTPYLNIKVSKQSQQLR